MFILIRRDSFGLPHLMAADKNPSVLAKIARGDDEIVRITRRKK